MKLINGALLAVLLLSACGGNPFLVDTDPDGSGPTGTTGTVNVSAKTPIERRETKTKSGNGYVASYAYDKTKDTFAVDGLAFDGGNVYKRVPTGRTPAAIDQTFNVYEASSTYADNVTGTPIDQFLHRTIYGVSKNGKTTFAIVRTGAYRDYGFGGFVYARNGKVTLPNTGQAGYTGKYAGLRDFTGAGGLEYASGDMSVAIDFNDFNDGDGVQGRVYNRKIFDMNGKDITAGVLAGINKDLDAPLTAIPELLFAVGPGVVSAAGEIAGEVDAGYSADGKPTLYQSGKYYALITDTDKINAGEIVGVIVVDGDDKRGDGVTVRETGGFIVYR